MNDRSIKNEYKFFITYSTFTDLIVHHEEALSMLADSGRMPSVKYFAWDCMEACTDYFQTGHYYKYLLTTVVRFFFFTMLEAMIFMQIQATSVGFSKCFTKAGVEPVADKQLVASVLISICTTGLTFGLTVVNVIKIYRNIDKASIEPGAGRDKELMERNLAFNIKARDYNRHVVMALFVVISAAFMFFWVYGVAKLWMNAFVCHCGWNYKGFPLEKGCVNVAGKGPVDIFFN